MSRLTMIALALLSSALCAQSYTSAWANQAYTNTALSSPSVFSMADDTITPEQTPAGFSLDFFGMTCDRFRVGSNGYITLGNAANPPSTVSGWTPDLAQGGMVIAPLWLDLNHAMSAADVLCKYTPATGGGPGQLVVRWGPVMTRTLHPSTGPFQQAPGAVLFELVVDTATGVITFRYGYPNWHCPEPNGNLYSQCIAGPSGTGQEIICQPVGNTFSADGEMLAYSYDFQITFTPTSPNLIVSDGAPVTYGLPAAGTQRDFGGQDINAGATAPRTITISNWGNGPLDITAVSITGADAASFSLDTSMTAPGVAPNSSTTFEVSFDPATTGAKSAQIEITHTDAAQQTPFVFEVAGTGMPTSIFPVIEVHESGAAGAWLGNGVPAAGLREFGTVDTGSQSAAITIYIQNTGNVALSLGAPACNSTHFIIDATGVPSSLAPGASATFTVAFAPQSAGNKAASVTFGHNDVTTATPFVVNFSGVAMGSGDGGGGGGGCAAAVGGLWLPLLPLALLLWRRRMRVRPSAA